jgi:hypothetical protein
MKLKKAPMVFSVIAAIALLTYYVPIPVFGITRLLLFPIEKRLNADIELGSLKVYLWRSIEAERIAAAGKGGFGLKAESARIGYDLASIVSGRLHIHCELEGVVFYKGGSIMDSVSGALNIDVLGGTAFEKVTGDFFVGPDDTITQDLTLDGEEMKIVANALTDKKDSIRCILTMHLREDLANEIPDRVRGEILEGGEGPWRKVSVGIMGNYKKPSINIVTERYKLKYHLKNNGAIDDDGPSGIIQGI